MVNSSMIVVRGFKHIAKTDPANGSSFSGSVLSTCYLWGFVVVGVIWSSPFLFSILSRVAGVSEGWGSADHISVVAKMSKSLAKALADGLYFHWLVVFFILVYMVWACLSKVFGSSNLGSGGFSGFFKGVIFSFFLFSGLLLVPCFIWWFGWCNVFPVHNGTNYEGDWGLVVCVWSILFFFWGVVFEVLWWVFFVCGVQGTMISSKLKGPWMEGVRSENSLWTVLSGAMSLAAEVISNTVKMSIKQYYVGFTVFSLHLLSCQTVSSGTKTGVYVSELHLGTACDLLVIFLGCITFLLLLSFALQFFCREESGMESWAESGYKNVSEALKLLISLRIISVFIYILLGFSCSWGLLFYGEVGKQVLSCVSYVGSGAVETVATTAMVLWVSRWFLYGWSGLIKFFVNLEF